LKIFHLRSHWRLNRSAVFFAVMAAAAIARGQTPAATDASQTDQTGELQKVTVTGYIVPHIGDGPQPVITLDQTYINDRAATSVTDVLNNLPQNSVGSFTTAVNSGNSFSPGGAAVSLRGLGPQSTLVLIDGERFPAFPFPQNFQTSFVDTNSIPIGAVDHIEVLKDGGSATYGSDAIAGVVNIILKDDYQGSDIAFHYGISQRGDDETYRAQATSGFSLKPTADSKFSVVASLEYFENSPIDAADRGFSNVLDHGKFSSGYNNQFQDLFPTSGTYTGLTTGNSFFVPGGSKTSNIQLGSHPYDASERTVYNTDLLAREQRFGAFVKANYEINEFIKIHEEFINQNNTETSVTPAQGFGFTDQLIIPANNPFNTTGEALQPTGQDFKYLGPWRTVTKINTLRNVGGITLQNLPKSWFADFSYVYGESDATETVQNSINRSRMQSALNGTLPGFNGIFFNPFVDSAVSKGGNSAGMIDAIRTTQQEFSRTSLSSLNFKAGGELIDLPAGPITIGFGAEYRDEAFIAGNDVNNHSTQLIGGLVVSNVTSADFPGQLTRGRRSIDTGYGEISIPIFGGKFSFPGMKTLELLIDERYDNYSDFGGASKPKFSLRYKPFDDLTFRATYAEGFRAPSLAELFTVQIQELPATPLTDPKTGQTGLVPTLFVQGNPNLQPEQSYSYYLDATWSPGSADPEHSWWGWANGFTAYVDWYQVERHNDIMQLPAQVILSGNNPANVIRNPNTGTVEFINDPFTNIGGTLTDGMDFGFSYNSKEYKWGKIEAALDATYIYNYTVKTTTPTGKATLWDEEDSFNQPDFRMTASLFYSKTLFGTDTFRSGFILNYADSEHDALDNFKGTNPQGGTQPNGLVHRIGSFTTVDWQVSYRLGPPADLHPVLPGPGYSKDGKRVVGEKAVSPVVEGKSGGIRNWLANTTLTFGITNIGDVKPPFADVTVGYDASVASAVGRAYYVEIEKKF
jgi:iron complex outermembrane receptor protein